jgi:pyruvate, orthophosphate dikinase
MSAMPDKKGFSARRNLFLIGAGAGAKAIAPELAGSKAAGLAQMARLGLTVPPAFVLSTQMCKPVIDDAPGAAEALSGMIAEGIQFLEHETGRRFGDARAPLFVSVRSGAARSMPGMMDTLLNTGMNAATVRGFIRQTGNPRLAWDCYRRFLQAYAEVVGGADAKPFAAKLAEAMQAEGASSEAELDPEVLERLTLTFASLAEGSLGVPVPADAMKQLHAAVRAVYRSWESPRAQEYRRLNGLEDLAGTAVTVQAMVYGNAGGRSGSGVAFTRDPATGEPGLYVDFLFDAQGEDVVSGRRVPDSFALLKERMPEIAEALAGGGASLETEFKDMQDIEFTVEEGRLYFLQTRPGKRTPRAALRILTDLVHEGILGKTEAARRATDIPLEATAETRFKDSTGAIARGTPASAGVASGRAVFEAAHVAAFAEGGDPVILIRPEISTDDIAGLASAEGILTAVGGRTAHAAVVARQLGKICVVGCAGLQTDSGQRMAALGEHTIHEGDWISLDGATGDVFLGRREIITSQADEVIAEVRRWMRDAGFAGKR